MLKPIFTFLYSVPTTNATWWQIEKDGIIEMLPCALLMLLFAVVGCFAMTKAPTELGKLFCYIAIIASTAFWMALWYAR